MKRDHKKFKMNSQSLFTSVFFEVMSQVALSPLVMDAVFKYGTDSTHDKSKAGKIMEKSAIFLLMFPFKQSKQ